MDQLIEGTMDTREIIKGKLREHFDGKIVRKDLTKKIKEGANVPVYVLEFLLGQYCGSDDPEKPGRDWTGRYPGNGQGIRTGSQNPEE